MSFKPKPRKRAKRPKGVAQSKWDMMRHSNGAEALRGYSAPRRKYDEQRGRSSN